MVIKTAGTAELAWRQCCMAASHLPGGRGCSNNALDHVMDY